MISISGRCTLTTTSFPSGNWARCTWAVDAAANGSWSGNRDYQLVMDQRLHALEIQVGQPETIRSPNGPIQAIRVRAISKSPELFARNKPRAVWVAAAKPVVVFADVETRFGAVRATLSKWEIDGQPVAW